MAYDAESREKLHGHVGNPPLSRPGVLSLSKGDPVKPSALDHLVVGPQVAGCRLLHNDDHHVLVINGRLASLTPTEYLLCMTLLRQRERWEAAMGQIPLCVSLGALQRISGI